MNTETMAMALQDAWPGLPAGLGGVLRKEWDALTPRIEVAETAGLLEGEVHPINEFTMPLANMARIAGFHNDAQGEEFISAAIDAAGVPMHLRSTVSITSSYNSSACRLADTTRRIPSVVCFSR